MIHGELNLVPDIPMPIFPTPGIVADELVIEYGLECGRDADRDFLEAWRKDVLLGIESAYSVMFGRDESPGSMLCTAAVRLRYVDFEQTVLACLQWLHYPKARTIEPEKEHMVLFDILAFAFAIGNPGCETSEPFSDRIIEYVFDRYIELLDWSDSSGNAAPEDFGFPVHCGAIHIRERVLECVLQSKRLDTIKPYLPRLFLREWARGHAYGSVFEGLFFKAFCYKNKDDMWAWRQEADDFLIKILLEMSDDPLLGTDLAWENPLRWKRSRVAGLVMTRCIPPVEGKCSFRTYMEILTIFSELDRDDDAIMDKAYEIEGYFKQASLKKAEKWVRECLSEYETVVDVWLNVLHLEYKRIYG